MRFSSGRERPDFQRVRRGGSFNAGAASVDGCRDGQESAVVPLSGTAPARRGNRIAQTNRARSFDGQPARGFDPCPKNTGLAARPGPADRNRRDGSLIHKPVVRQIIPYALVGVDGGWGEG